MDDHGVAMNFRGVVRWSGLAAALAWLAAVVGFGARLPGYDQMRHPVALLGAHGVPGAMPFNLLGFMLPGVLAVVTVSGLARRLPSGAGWPLRLGVQMQMVAALAFIGMGLLPLDAGDVDGPASGLHASMWMLWALAFMLGAMLLSWGRQPGWRRVAIPGWLVGMLVFVLGFVLGGPFAQRLLFLLWGLWLALLPVGRGE